MDGDVQKEKKQNIDPIIKFMCGVKASSALSGLDQMLLFWAVVAFLAIVHCPI
jgi:hypothetical protein